MKTYSNKGQAATEFIMTYGWAIMASLLAIGALSYFGFLSPTSLLPEKCQFSDKIACLGSSLDSTNNTLKVSLSNGQAQSMYEPKFNYTFNGKIGPCAYNNNTWTSDEKKQINCTILGSTFSKNQGYKIYIQASYKKDSNTYGYKHTAVGDIFVKAN